MKDDTGVYYHPFPGNKRVRMYVRHVAGEVEFRMADADDPKLWEDHGWVPYSALEQAAAMFTGRGFDPKRTYDLEVARAVLRSEERK